MTEKSQLRASLTQQRNRISPEKKKQLDRAIVEKILHSSLFRNATAVFLYAPIRGEINLLPLARAAQARGKRVAFPRCDPETEQMQFFELLPNQKLTVGAYGIPEPQKNAPLCVADRHTLCILPALACDADGYRLGYGKGYYDKYLSDFRGITLCAIYRSFLISSLPRESHDIPAQYLCTEKEIVSTKPLEHTKTDDPDRDSDGSSATEPTADESRKSRAPARHERRRAVAWSEISKSLHVLSKKVRLLLRVKGDSAKQKALHSVKTTDHIPLLLILTVFGLLLLSRLTEPLFTRENELAGIVILQILIFVLPALLYCKLRGDSFSERIRFCRLEPSKIPLLCCALIAMICGGLLMSILTGGIASLSGNFTLYTIFVAKTGNTASSHITLLLAYAVLPAFSEELVFRSVLCAEYEKHGVPVAVAVSALFFAMLHFSFPNFLTYLLLGTILASVLYITRSFWSVFLLHLLYNVFCLYGQPYLSAFYVTAGSNDIFIFCITVLFLLASAVGAGQARNIYHVYANKNLSSDYTAPLPWKAFPKAFFRALFSPVTAVCILLWLIFSILNL